MSSQLPEEQVQAPTFTPTTDEPLSPAEQLARIEQSLETFPSEVDLVVAPAVPAPIGRSWSFDWQLRRFDRGASRGPLTTRGQESLKEWIAKCLQTARGAHPVHPEGYGLDGGLEGIVGAPVGTVIADFEQKVEDALLFHPRISAVEDFAYEWDADDDFLAVTLTVVLDGDTPVAVDNLQLAL
jgi:hypothetical protein